MRRVGDDFEACAGNQLCEGLHQRRRCRAILIADDDHRREIDALGDGREVGIADRGAGGGVTFDRLAHKHRAIAGEFGAALPMKFRREPFLHDTVSETADALASGGFDSPVPHLAGADLVRCVAEDERADQVRPRGIERLGDQSADGQAAYDSRFHLEMIEQGSEIGGMGFDCIGRVAELAQPMSALVIGDDRVVAGEAHDHVTPDAEIRTQRIGENDDRLAGGRADQLIVDDGMVQAGELHGLSLDPLRAYGPGDMSARQVPAWLSRAGRHSSRRALWRRPANG